jgi:chromosome segregation ATPase
MGEDDLRRGGGVTSAPDRWLTIPKATALMNAEQPPDEHISEKTARRRLASLDADAQRAGFRILRRFGPRSTLVNADALLQMLRVDTSRIEQEVDHLHSRFDDIERKTARNRQGIKDLRKQLRELAGRLDGIAAKAR